MHSDAGAGAGDALGREQLAKALIRKLSAYISGEMSKDEIIRPLARDTVAFRSTFTYMGRPDWAGRSAQYRNAIYRVYREAGVPSDSHASIQGNMRYHVGNAVRTMAPREDLEALGLDPQGPRDRAGRYRAKPARRGPPEKSPAPSARAAAPAPTRRVSAPPTLDPAALLVTALDLVRTAALLLRTKGSPAASKVGVAAWTIERAMADVAVA